MAHRGVEALLCCGAVELPQPRQGEEAIGNEAITIPATRDDDGRAERGEWRRATANGGEGCELSKRGTVIVVSELLGVALRKLSGEYSVCCRSGAVHGRCACTCAEESRPRPGPRSATNVHWLLRCPRTHNKGRGRGLVIKHHSLPIPLGGMLVCPCARVPCLGCAAYVLGVFVLLLLLLLVAGSLLVC